MASKNVQEFVIKVRLEADDLLELVSIATSSSVLPAIQTKKGRLTLYRSC
jgi:hypothetical protein